ncbi:hypothetical protein MMC22_000448 [Lobaria immixta]|nr:hypothetical protein [Lobaria immixta]
MKLTLLGLALSMGPVSINACVTAHVYLRNCIFDGDTLSAQVFDNDVEVCKGAKTINLASSDSEFCIDGCQPGYSFCVKDNAKTATYKNGNVYSKTMTAAKSDSNEFTCGEAGSHELKGTEYESCFSDFFGNCNAHRPCDLCDFKATC